MKVYVSTYAKYNLGSLAGAWFDLKDYSDKADFIEACLKLHEDEEDPELMFADWEDIPDGLVSESHVSPECWDLPEAYDDHG